MNDLISRRAAIDGLYEMSSDIDHLCTLGDYVSFLESLSAQPEIIRCKDCEYGEQNDSDCWYCRGLGCQIGDDDGNGFCSDGEKRK